MYDTSLRSVTAEIEALLEQKFGAKGRNLNEKIRSAGRRLPRSIRRELDYLAQAEARYDNPKRGGEYEADRVVRAYQHSVDYLEKIDVRARRRYGLAAWFAGNVVNIVILSGVTIYILTALQLI